METRGNPLITSAPRSGGDVLRTPQERLDAVLVPIQND